MTVYLIFGAGALATFALRSTMTVFDGRLLAAERIERGLAFMSPAVLAAFVASAVLLSSGSLALPNPIVVSAIAVGAAAARYRGNVAYALAVGLPIYWVGVLAGLV